MLVDGKFRRNRRGVSSSRWGVHGVIHHEMVEDLLLKLDCGLSGLQVAEPSCVVPVVFVVLVEGLIASM